MNWARGLFRVWAVLSVIWIVLILGNEVVPENALAAFNYEQRQTDLTVSDFKIIRVEDGISTVQYGELTLEIDFRTAPTLADRESALEELSVELNQRAAAENELHRRRLVGLYAASMMAFLPVIVPLLLGMAGLWAARGFKKDS